MSQGILGVEIGGFLQGADGLVGLAHLQIGAAQLDGYFIVVWGHPQQIIEHRGGL